MKNKSIENLRIIQNVSNKPMPDLLKRLDNTIHRLSGLNHDLYFKSLLAISTK